jgi:alpha-tubulin suppressor-like RCC1 family protein
MISGGKPNPANADADQPGRAAGLIDLACLDHTIDERNSARQVASSYGYDQRIQCSPKISRQSMADSGATAASQRRRGEESMRRTRIGGGPRRLMIGIATIVAAFAVTEPFAGPAQAADAIGTARGWGLNSSGQVGDGTTVNRLTPTPVRGLTNVTQIDAGTLHSLAVLRDLTVRAWGANNTGQLGDGTLTNRTSPVQVGGLTNIVTVSAGAGHSLALASDGTVWAWGLNNRGQLGDGSLNTQTRPVRVVGLPGPAARISAGDNHSVVRLQDGSVWAWGSNINGQLGDGTLTSRSRPVRSQVPGQALAVSAGAEHTLALRTDLVVFAWGDNTQGQLGDGTTLDKLLPNQVPGLTSVIQISAGGLHNLVRRGGAPRTAFAWGNNAFGQLGDGTTTTRLRPVQVLGLVDPNGVFAGGRHSLAQELDGATAVRAWGNNSQGQLGDGTLVSKVRPVVVPGIASDLVALSAGGLHSISAVILA